MKSNVKNEMLAIDEKWSVSKLAEEPCGGCTNYEDEILSEQTMERTNYKYWRKYGMTEKVSD